MWMYNSTLQYISHFVPVNWLIFMRVGLKVNQRPALSSLSWVSYLQTGKATIWLSWFSVSVSLFYILFWHGCAMFSPLKANYFSGEGRTIPSEFAELCSTVLATCEDLYVVGEYFCTIFSKHINTWPIIFFLCSWTRWDLPMGLSSNGETFCKLEDIPKFYFRQSGRGINTF